MDKKNEWSIKKEELIFYFFLIQTDEIIVNFLFICVTDCTEHISKVE